MYDENYDEYQVDLYRKAKAHAALQGKPLSHLLEETLEEMLTKAERNTPSPFAALNQLHENQGGLAREDAEEYLANVKQDRTQWREGP